MHAVFCRVETLGSRDDSLIAKLHYEQASSLTSEKAMSTRSSRRGTIIVIDKVKDKLLKEVKT